MPLRVVVRAIADDCGSRKIIVVSRGIPENEKTTENNRNAVQSKTKKIKTTTSRVHATR